MRRSTIILILLLATTISCSSIPKINWGNLYFSYYVQDTDRSITLWDRKAKPDVNRGDLLGCLALRDVKTLKIIQKGISSVWENISFKIYESFDGTRKTLVPLRREKGKSQEDVYGCLQLRDIKLLKRLRNHTNK